MFAAFATVVSGRAVEQATPFTPEEYWALWKHFQTLDGTANYYTSTEHNDRYDVFCKNMDFAREFNTNKTNSFKLGVTMFADKTQDEFKQWLKLTSGTKPKKTGLRKTFDATKYGTDPATKDWVDLGAVTPIKNQGQCGSCWAFSTTGGIEGQNFLVNNKLSSFSEQELVDCSGAQGNQGCNGGLMDDGFEYVEASGLCYESAYPYEATDGTCRSSSCTSQVSVSGYTDITQGDTAALKTACANEGPISIAVDANTYWQLYTSGIFSHYCNPNSLDHGVLLVGYGSDYWKVKNSWGTGWGEDGYIRLTGTSENTCGLANSASYPKVDHN